MKKKKIEEHCKFCMCNILCDGIKPKIGDEIPLHKLKVGMKVLAISPFNKIEGKIKQIQNITFGVYDGTQTWGFFLNEPCKATVYKLS